MEMADELVSITEGGPLRETEGWDEAMIGLLISEIGR